jgi:hypothetical protein
VRNNISIAAGRVGVHTEPGILTFGTAPPKSMYNGREHVRDARHIKRKAQVLNTREEFFAAIERYRKQLSPDEEAAEWKAFLEEATNFRPALAQAIAQTKKATEAFGEMTRRVADAGEWIAHAQRDLTNLSVTFKNSLALPHGLFEPLSSRLSLPEITVPSTQLQKSFELAGLSTGETKAFDLTKQFSTTPLMDSWRDLELTSNLSCLVNTSLVKQQVPTHIIDVSVVVDVEETDETRLAAVNRLLKRNYKYPIARTRWQAHHARLQNAIQERAEILKTSESEALHQAAQQALFTVCAELKLPRSRSCVVIDNRRIYVRDLTAWSDLGVSHLLHYVKNRLSDELMDILVPDWRQFETKDAIDKMPRFVSIEDTDTTANLDSVPSTTNESDNSLSVSYLFSHSALSRDQKMLMRLMIEEDLNPTAAGLRMGKSEAWGRVTVSRIRQKLKKTS